MIATSQLIQYEKDTLDKYGEVHSGSELAEFVAKRTKKFLLQELIAECKWKFSNHKEIIRWLENHKDL